ncbi:MAG TPA: hypothetical protein VF334_14280 [Polyangia bacterium]
MGPRAALTLATALSLAGCNGADSNGNGGADMGTATIHDMAAGGCAVVHAAATDPTTGAVTDHAPARLTAYADVSGVSGPHWTLTRTGDPTSVTPTPTDSSGLRVQYDVTAPGTWTFVVTFDFGSCRGSDQVTVGNPLGVQQLYRFRALPPETSGFPLTDTAVTVTGGTPLTRDLTLDAGTAVSGILRASGAAIAGEVRLIAGDGPDAVGLAGTDGAFMLAVQAAGDYTPLFIPRSTTLAPHLGTTAKGAAFVGASFDVPGGVAVGGSVVDGAAAAIAGAHVVLRAGALPSGPGLTSGAGAFTLYAEPGVYTLSFGADDWPQGSLANVVVPGGGTSIAIAYTTARVAVGGSVVADDGTTPVANARVTITSRPLGPIATVSVGGGALMAAPGRVARVVTTDANGALPAMQLPAGTYDLIVEPPGPSLDGLTAITEVLAGAATWTLRLDKPVPLAVTVDGPDGNGVGNVLLTAIETVGLGAAPTGVTDATGKYTFVIDKGAPLELLVEPAAGAKLAGARVPLAANAGSATVALGAGLLVSGVVRSPAGTAQPGVRVEALCWSCGSTTPLATSISDGSGTYRIYVPDPGNVILDGGVSD